MARKMRSTWGNVSRTAPGVFRLRWYEDTPQGRRRMSETVRGTRREADRRLAQIRLSVREDPARPLRWYFERCYWPDASKKLRPNTLAAYRSAWRQIEPVFGDSPVSAIKPMDIQALMDGMARNMAGSAKGILKRTLDYAVMYGEIAANPADAPLRLPEAEMTFSKEIWTLAELRAAWDVVRGWDFEASYILQAFGGARVGESLGVRIGEIAGRDGYATFTVMRTVHKDGRIADPKTYTSIRTALILEPFASRLIELAGTGEHEGGWLVPNGLGDPLSRRAIQRRWERAMKRLPDGMRPIPMRNLRNSFETWMHWEAGLPVEVVSKLMGHTTSKITLENYDRPSDETVISAAIAALPPKSKVPDGTF